MIEIYLYLVFACKTAHLAHLAHIAHIAHIVNIQYGCTIWQIRVMPWHVCNMVETQKFLLRVMFRSDGWPNFVGISSLRTLLI